MRCKRAAVFLMTGFFLVVLGGASPLLAYTIHLKDGSQLVAKSKYEVQGDRAIITLPSGTQTFLRLSAIDIPKTEKANETNLGTAIMMEDSSATELAGPPTAQEKKARLGDLIASRQATARVPREAEPPPEPTVSVEEPKVPRTEAGYSDLSHWQRQAVTDTDLASEVVQLYRNQGIEELELHRGTQGDRLLVDIVTNSEASIFRALEVSSAVLLQLMERRPGQFSGLELYFNTYRRDPAGQFFLDEDRARMLASKAVDVPTFFLSYVEF